MSIVHFTLFVLGGKCMHQGRELGHGAGFRRVKRIASAGRSITVCPQYSVA